MTEQDQPSPRECVGGPFAGQQLAEPNRALRSAHLRGELPDAPAGRYVAMQWEERPVYVWVEVSGAEAPHTAH